MFWYNSNNMINKDELLFVVDKNNNPIDPKPRHEVHQNGYWHRISHVWIINSKSEILCQKRSLLKDKAPGKWEPFFGGHLNPEIEYLGGAKVEIKEELGINLIDKDLNLWKIFKNIHGKEFQGVFVYKWDGDIDSIKFEVEEIDQIKWVPFEDVSKFVLNEAENNWSKMGYEKELLGFIKSM